MYAHIVTIIINMTFKVLRGGGGVAPSSRKINWHSQNFVSKQSDHCVMHPCIVTLIAISLLKNTYIYYIGVVFEWFNHLTRNVTVVG